MLDAAEAQPKRPLCTTGTCSVDTITDHRLSSTRLRRSRITNCLYYTFVCEALFLDYEHLRS